MVSARGKGICQLTVGYAFNGVTLRVIDQLWGQDGRLSGKFSKVKDRPMSSALGSVTDVTKPRLVTPAKQRRDPCSGPPTDWVVLFEFPFGLVGKSTMAFPTGQWRIQGKDQGGPPPLVFGPNKNFFWTPPPPPSYLRVWVTGHPPYLKVWIWHCGPFMVHTQIPVYRWRLRAWIAALFHRQT